MAFQQTLRNTGDILVNLSTEGFDEHSKSHMGEGEAIAEAEHKI